MSLALKVNELIKQAQDPSVDQFGSFRGRDVHKVDKTKYLGKSGKDIVRKATIRRVTPMRVVRDRQISALSKKTPGNWRSKSYEKDIDKHVKKNPKSKESKEFSSIVSDKNRSEKAYGRMPGYNHVGYKLKGKRLMSRLSKLHSKVGKMSEAEKDKAQIQKTISAHKSRKITPIAEKARGSSAGPVLTKSGKTYSEAVSERKEKINRLRRMKQE